MGKSTSSKGGYTKPMGKGPGPGNWPTTTNPQYSTAQGTHESGYDDYGRGKSKGNKGRSGSMSGKTKGTHGYS